MKYAEKGREAIERARELFASDEIEIDDNPETSSSESGTWVAAWVFVPSDDE